MPNEFYLSSNHKVPIKETLDYAKNVVFCITLETIAMTIGTPHPGTSPRWFWILFATLMSVATGYLSAMTSQLYHENWPELSSKQRWGFTSATILIVFAAGMAVKVRLAEGW